MKAVRDVLGFVGDTQAAARSSKPELPLMCALIMDILKLFNHMPTAHLLVLILLVYSGAFG